MELKASEFRQGNLVYDNLGRIVRTSEVRLEHLVFHLSNGNKIKHTLNSFKPIELSEEILFKCGGYKFKGWDDMEFIRFDDYSPNMFELEITDDGFFYDEVKIEFLHDLQNCYYFHRNRKTELEINL